jgi:hypothetical protein
MPVDGLNVTAVAPVRFLSVDCQGHGLPIAQDQRRRMLSTEGPLDSE